MAGDEYEAVGGGALKLKGTNDKKKKKKSSTSSKERHNLSTSTPSSSTSAAVDSAIVTRPKQTCAEERFEQVQKKRLQDKVKKQATQTHKERVAQFNQNLEKLSEHYDIPKVGPG